MSSSPIEWKPLTSENWHEFEALFGSKGACAGCWCMLWRTQKSQYEAGKGQVNKQAIHDLVKNDHPTGILAYYGGIPAGWCSVAPRTSFPAIKRSRLFKPTDDLEAWSVTCLFVARAFRKKGISIVLLEAAIEHAKNNNAAYLEGYPVIPKDDAMPDVFAWNGLQSAYLKAGFTEVRKPSTNRSLMRFNLKHNPEHAH